NAAQNGYSAQPMFGGPVYFYRNLLYQVPGGSPFKLSAVPAGILAYHNTMIGEQTVRDPYSNAHFRNNLFLGRDTPGRGVMTWANATDQYSSDYNGYRPKREDWKSFATLAEFRTATGQEAHGVELDFDVFERMVPPDPSKRHAVYHAMDLDFRLKP